MRKLYQVPVHFMVWAEGPAEAQAFVAEKVDELAAANPFGTPLNPAWDATEVQEATLWGDER